MDVNCLIQEQAKLLENAKKCTKKAAPYVFSICSVGRILVIKALRTLFEPRDGLLAPPGLQHTKFVVFTTCSDELNCYSSIGATHCEN